MNAPKLSVLPRSSGLLKQFSTTVVDQVVISGANFLVGLLLIRQTSSSDYAIFVLVQSAITLMISGQMAWLSSPLAVVAPAKTPEVRHLMVGSVEASQRRFLTLAAAAALLVPIGGFFLKVWTLMEASAVALGIIACWAALLREYLRGVLLIFRRPEEMLRTDMIYVAVLLIVRSTETPDSLSATLRRSGRKCAPWPRGQRWAP